MKAMNISVKNMNCKCSMNFVQEVIKHLGIQHYEVAANIITFPNAPSELQRRALEERLRTEGLEVVLEKKDILIERIKYAVREYVNSANPPKLNLSGYLTEQLRFNYSYLSTIFAEAEGTNIRDYAITLRIDRAKNMLVQEKMDLMEISVVLHYSSVAHLAAQFRKVTGVTTSQYKREVAAAPMQVQRTRLAS
jgi:YesN/AraC family two-component response regulator